MSGTVSASFFGFSLEVSTRLIQFLVTNTRSISGRHLSRLRHSGRSGPNNTPGPRPFGTAKAGNRADPAFSYIQESSVSSYLPSLVASFQLLIANKLEKVGLISSLMFP